MPHTARPYILHEATYAQVLEFGPKVAVLPWGATEAHNYHLPHGTDNIEGVALGELAVEKANEQGAKCILLPVVPFGIDHSQLAQAATITMRASTQQAVLYDIAESLVRQGIDRLVLLNFHGGNEFKSMIRDVMLELPIFIVQVHGFKLDPGYLDELTDKGGDHANEFETAMVMHLTPDWVAPLETAGDGAQTPSELPAVSNTPGVWCVRDWAALTESTGTGNPKQATAESGKRILDRFVNALTPILVQLSNAENGDFPFIIRDTAV